MTPVRRALLVPAVAIVAGCEGQQRILDTRSADAARIADLWWAMLIVAVAVCILVAVALGVGVWRARRRERGDSPAGVNGPLVIALGGVALPAVVVFALLAFNYRVGTEILRPADWSRDALHIEVIGHKFWWEVRYPQFGIVTANEFRIPAGERVRIDLMAPDVIHSFWVPQLHGKLDMIPGRRNTLWLQADEPGIFRGQCAEFCGTSHALMVFWLEALAPDDFGRWVDTSRRERHLTLTQAQGRAVFVRADCHQCHAVPGLPLDERIGQPGPDLSDFASRRFIGAGTVENTRANLAAWILDPHRIKPGVRMPATPALTAEQLEALLDYLESLQ